MRRNMGRRSNVGNSAGGPLITGHLQDIDMELELLKRKREMIEQQQQLLVMEQQFKSSRHYDSYDQMRYNEPEQHGSNRDFASLYDNGPKHRNQFGRKRQAEPQWQYEGPKRTPSKRKTNPSQFNPMQGTGNAGPANRYQKPAPGQGYGSKASPKGPAPLMSVKAKQFIGRKIIDQKSSKLPQKEFKPTKVSKPKAGTAPNKIASQPLAERKKLVSAANESVSETDVSRMLLPDRVPTQQVSGRLELALGAIMKNIRDMVGNESPHAIMLRSPQLQRVMKQAVRERIRTVMLGKVVGSLFDILEIYREEFPTETDVDIVNIALDAAGVPASEREDKSKMVEKGNPDEFFRLNMSCLLETKLIEMFENLEEMYAGKSTAAEVDCGDENEKAVMDLKTKSEEHKLLEDSKDFKSFLNTDIKARDVKRFLPRLMKKFIPYMIKILNHDGVFQSTKAAITLKAKENAGSVSNTKKGEVRGDSEPTVFASGTPSNMHSSYNLPYYVKIMGRPTLPKRKVMQAFLNDYFPKSIKKHRTIHNLLFVGFSEKRDFDTMVAADGTAIGRSLLSVRICTKGGTQESTGQTSENKDTDFSVDVTTDGDVKEEPKSDGDIINDELDGQITDLLSSIRKSEEDDEKESGTEVTDEKNYSEDTIDAVAEQDNKADENKPNGDQTTIKEEKEEEGDAQNDEEMDSKDANEHENPETATMTVEDDQDNVDAIMNAEENIDDQSTAGEENQASDNAETQNSETTDETEKTTENSDNQETEKLSKGDKVEDLKNNTSDEKEKTTENSDNQEREEQSKGDKVEDLKNNASSRSTPSRMSARLASVTPSTIVTRRTSRLANN